jgi:two-component system KDP operon response regulator KdpE
MTAQVSILVVDDEQPLRDFIRKNLAARGFSVHTAGNGLEALAIFNTQPLELIILDLMMPGMDGLETTRRIRQASPVPIIILTALSEERDKVAALDLGADDYLTKPFGVEELLARVRAVLRRARGAPGPQAGGQLCVGDLVLDPDAHTVTQRDQPVRITPTEFELLHYLMRNAGKVITHRELLQRVWGAEYGDEAEYLRVYIRRLRQKIEADPLHPRYLLTEHGVGYRFDPG